jgi:hypothetical protein
VTGVEHCTTTETGRVESRPILPSNSRSDCSASLAVPDYHHLRSSKYSSPCPWMAVPPWRMREKERQTRNHRPSSRRWLSVGAFGGGWPWVMAQKERTWVTWTAESIRGNESRKKIVWLTRAKSAGLQRGYGLGAETNTNDRTGTDALGRRSARQTEEGGDSACVPVLQRAVYGRLLIRLPLISMFNSVESHQIRPERAG